MIVLRVDLSRKWQWNNSGKLYVLLVTFTSLAFVVNAAHRGNIGKAGLASFFFKLLVFTYSFHPQVVCILRTFVMWALKFVSTVGSSKVNILVFKLILNAIGF